MSEARFVHTFADALPGLTAAAQGAVAKAPKVVVWNAALAEVLGVSAWSGAPESARWLTGSDVAPGSRPVAQAYAGHQFGRFVPSLGDGRALLLGELIGSNGARVDLSLKGSGRTHFSRGGDGRATLGPMLREYIVSEAMHALGIPTTRALAVTETGEPVVREGLRRGAVLARVAQSHIRVGTFEYVAARGDVPLLQSLFDYAVARHDASLGQRVAPMRWLRAVARRQAELIAAWMNVGFIHGVMNTDNMAISGETIDYGPCAFLEAYAPDSVFSSIDHQGRYAYGNQPRIAQWNLARLAETLLPLCEDLELARTEAGLALGEFASHFELTWLAGLRQKLGLMGTHDNDAELGQQWLALLAQGRCDFTLAFRALADLAEQGAPAVTGFGAAARGAAADSAEFERAWLTWHTAWSARCGADPREVSTRAAAMRAVNPVYIPRNHLVEAALASAEQGDLAPLRALVAAISSPYVARPELAVFAEPAPPEFTAGYQTFCGT